MQVCVWDNKDEKGDRVIDRYNALQILKARYSGTSTRTD